jgi:hypothetical protein
MTRRSLIPALILFLSAAAWSAGAYRYPLRQIDRPLVLPAKMWQERLIQNSVIDLDHPQDDQTTESLQGFWPTLPSYAFTDRLMWVAIPAPYFRYLLIGNPIDSAHGMAARGLSLALEGGLTSIGYSSREGSILIGALGLLAKRPLSSRVWGEGNLGLGSGWYSEGADVNIMTGSAGLGFQVSDRLFLRQDFGVSLALDELSDTILYGTLEAGANLTSNLSLGLHVSLLSLDGSAILNPGANLAFQW